MPRVWQRLFEERDDIDRLKVIVARAGRQVASVGVRAVPHAALEEASVHLSLHFHDERPSVPVPAPDIDSGVFVERSESVDFPIAVAFNFGNLPVLRQQEVQQSHENCLVPGRGENGLEAGVREHARESRELQLVRFCRLICFHKTGFSRYECKSTENHPLNEIFNG